jgi:hypothetical protein
MPRATVCRYKLVTVPYMWKYQLVTQPRKMVPYGFVRQEVLEILIRALHDLLSSGRVICL